jgi:hypothetical protein
MSTVRPWCGLARPPWPLGQANSARPWAECRPSTVHRLFLFRIDLIPRKSVKLQKFIEKKIKLRKYKLNFLGILVSRYLQ